TQTLHSTYEPKAPPGPPVVQPRQALRQAGHSHQRPPPRDGRCGSNGDAIRSVGTIGYGRCDCRDVKEKFETPTASTPFTKRAIRLASKWNRGLLFPRPRRQGDLRGQGPRYP